MARVSAGWPCSLMEQQVGPPLLCSENMSLILSSEAWEESADSSSEGSGMLIFFSEPQKRKEAFGVWNANRKCELGVSKAKDLLSGAGPKLPKVVLKRNFLCQ
eukprot:TRINITY_DN65593_c3_g3_i1.p1 TRINITY_DN65593_c3_g3~~TRINITY_DN65593_c3_g3_i1.p1  ORF type:complete len:103 (+),score=0.27 TRINITY_DN65593_c3_g3_i1:74-382(+)